MRKMTTAWLAASAALFWGGEATGARPAVNSEACMSHCSLVRGEDGRAVVLCGCGEKKYPAHDNFFALRNRMPERFETEVRNRLGGATSQELSATGTNACTSEVAASREHPRSSKEFINLAQLSMRPTCECVRNRVQFPVLRSCAATKAGQILCQFDLALGAPAHEGPLRSPTLHDYQSCVAARINYQRPETCAAVVCQEQPRECPLGKELVNVADPESCCPSFECRGEDL